MATSGNLLDIYINATSGTIKFDDEIKRQNMTLIAYRVEYDSTFS